MKIALFGGAFNPVHNGHLTLIEEAKKKFGLEHIFIMPCKTSPYVNKYIDTCYIHRLNMLYKAIENIPYLSLSRYEIDGESPYTIDTVRYFKKQYYNHKLYFLCGPDAYKSFSTWKDWRKILNLINIKFAGYDFMKKECIIRSTVIRTRITDGDSVSDYLDPKVYNYIMKHDLYRR